MKTEAFSPPANPLQAATHPDPYPYYAELAIERPFAFDESIGFWVAASAEAVQTVFSHPLARVRPLGEPVPRALVGKPTGDIFGQLVRQMDNETHCPFKAAITATLGGLDRAEIASAARERVQALDAKHSPRTDPAGLTPFLFAAPNDVMAQLLGAPRAQFENIAAWVNAYALAVSPIATEEHIAAGNDGAAKLLALFREMFAAQREETLLAVLAQQARAMGRPADEMIIANAIGFLSQSYEASAALAGNTLLALAAHEDVRNEIKANRSRLVDVIQEVARCDPSTQSTRRFIADDCVIAGQNVTKGEGIILSIAAANRDPALNRDPGRFDIDRKDRRYLEFGHGAHACPANAFAPIVAEIIVAHLLADLDFAGLRERLSYRRSLHVRTPLFGAP